MTLKNILISIAVPLLLYGCSGTASEIRKDTLSYRWMFEGTAGSGTDSLWLTDHVLYSTDGKGASVSVVKDKSGSRDTLSYSFSGRRPAVSGMEEGDYILFSLPAEDIPDGSFIEFDATFGGDSLSPATYRIEYMEAGKWKDTGYTYPGSGDISTGAGAADTYQYTTVLKTFRLENSPEDGILRIRCVADGDKACDWTGLDGEGVSLFADFGFVAADIKELGTDEPEDTVKVLILGNSFTYFYGSPFMLKELAWKEGTALDIKANLKGGQTFGDHLSLSLSQSAVRAGGYDFAILQDQSQNHARYSSDSSRYSAVLGNFKALVAEIRKYSPECRIILDRTWAYEGGSFGGFGDYESFDTLLKNGADEMARGEQDIVIAPVGEAFTLCQKEYPDINLFYEDDKHPSAAGAYLKACVEYAVLSGKGFGDESPDCGIDESAAVRLRSIAERVTVN